MTASLLCAALLLQTAAASEAVATEVAPGQQPTQAIPREVIRRADGSVFKFATPRVLTAPQYPPRMAQMGAEGWVVLSFVVQRDGTVRDPVVIDSSRQAFERTALDAVRQFIYYR